MDYLLSREKLSCRSSNHCRLRSMLVNSNSVLRIYFSCLQDDTISKLNLSALVADESDVDLYYSIFNFLGSTKV